MIKIYGNKSCPYCKMALALAELKKMKYEYYTLNVDYSKAELLELVPDAKTIPQIFVDETYVGGYTEFEKYVNEIGE
jgi:glutaredoxin